MFLQQLEHHPWREIDSSFADILVIPFDVEASFAAGVCEGHSHLERLGKALKFIRGHELFQQRPESHFWLIHYWKMSTFTEYRNDLFPAADVDMLRHMTLGRFEWYHLNQDEFLTLNRMGESTCPGVPSMPLQQMESWRCTTIAPYTHNRMIPLAPPSYRGWAARPTRVHFRWDASKHFWRGATAVRNAAWKLDGQPGYVVGGHVPPEQYAKELQNSQFALVLRGDTPSSHHFSDAIAAGCVPIIISSGFSAVAAPFKSTVNMQDISFEIDEDDWLSDPVKALEQLFLHMGNDAQKVIYENLSSARRYLTWSPAEETGALQNAATALLIQAKNDC